jgi:hypothetical protein
VQTSRVDPATSHSRKRFLGHADIQTTVMVYGRDARLAHPEAVEALSSAVRGTRPPLRVVKRDEAPAPALPRRRHRSAADEV